MQGGACLILKPKKLCEWWTNKGWSNQDLNAEEDQNAFQEVKCSVLVLYHAEEWRKKKNRTCFNTDWERKSKCSNLRHVWHHRVQDNGNVHEHKAVVVHFSVECFVLEVTYKAKADQLGLERLQFEVLEDSHAQHQEWKGVYSYKHKLHYEHGVLLGLEDQAKGCEVPEVSSGIVTETLNAWDLFVVCLT